MTSSLCFRSISRKISTQVDLGDEIDFSELGLDNGEDEMSDSFNNTSSNGDPEEEEVVTRSPVVSNGGVKPVTRRESRGVSQVSIIWSLSSSHGHHGEMC